jgi:hypothetical protein
MIRYVFVVIAALFLPILGAAQCLTTLAPNPTFVPPAQYLFDAPKGAFWYGTDQLWTALGFDGKWNMRDNVLHGKGYRTKLTFWSRAFDWRTETEPKLVIIAKRLDVEAPSVVVAHANAVFIPSHSTAAIAPAIARDVAPGMMTAIDIPTAGCWEVTAHYRGHKLPFIVSVEP